MLLFQGTVPSQRFLHTAGRARRSGALNVEILERFELRAARFANVLRKFIKAFAHLVIFALSAALAETTSALTVLVNFQTLLAASFEHLCEM